METANKQLAAKECDDTEDNRKTISQLLAQSEQRHAGDTQANVSGCTVTDNNRRLHHPRQRDTAGEGEAGDGAEHAAVHHRRPEEAHRDQRSGS